MGNAESTNAEAQASASIDSQIADDRRQRENHVKLLLLGAGESGKSTIVKQMKMIYKDGFSPQDLTRATALIHVNVIQGIQALINGCKQLNISFASENEATASALLLVPCDGTAYTPDVQAQVAQMWKDPGIQAAAERLHEFQAQESAILFLNDLERINSDSFQPTTQDLLFAREITIGITETTFNKEKRVFHLYDVAGQRGARRKWMHYFDDCTSVVFVVGTSEFNQVIAEDQTTNRLVESLQLFDTIIHTKALANAGIILFLNKIDLLKVKIEKGHDLSAAIPSYKGGANVEAAKAAIQKEFMTLAQLRNVYGHWTCATDTQNVQIVFLAVTDQIMQGILAKSGFI
jgi:GTPase SAR1 family protein